MTTPQDHGPLQNSIDRVRGELERLVEMARDRGVRVLDTVGVRPPRTEFPCVDLTETNDAVHLVADLPGVYPEAVDLHVAGATLTLRGTITQPPLGQGGTIHRCERQAGRFERTLALPAVVDADAAVAELRHGVLHVRLPKNPVEVGRKVPVRPAGEICDPVTAPAL